MTNRQLDRWKGIFPFVPSMSAVDRRAAEDDILFERFRAGDVVYRQGARCDRYVMCTSGSVRSSRLPTNGEGVQLYSLSPGEGCPLTAQSLLSGEVLMADGRAGERTSVASLSAPVFARLMSTSEPFRSFVLEGYLALLPRISNVVGTHIQRLQRA